MICGTGRKIKYTFAIITPDHPFPKHIGFCISGHAYIYTSIHMPFFLGEEDFYIPTGNNSHKTLALFC